MLHRRFNQALVAGLCLSCFMRPAALRAETHRAATSSADVVLRPEGLLVKTLNAAGQPVAARPISIHAGGQIVAQGLTDATGSFLVRGLKAGAYRATTGGSQRLVRVWTRQAAPPSAVTELVLLDSQSVVRGQANRQVIATPLILGGIVAAVIAVALGLDGDDGDAS